MNNWIACTSEFHGRTPNCLVLGLISCMLENGSSCYVLYLKHYRGCSILVRNIEIKLSLSMLPLKPKQCVESIDKTWLVYLALSSMYSSVKCRNSPFPCSVCSGQHKLAICVLSSEWRLVTDDVQKVKVFFSYQPLLDSKLNRRK